MRCHPVGTGELSPCCPPLMVQYAWRYVCIFSEHRGIPTWSGIPSAPPALSQWRDGDGEEWQYPEDTNSCQQGWLPKPTALHLHHHILVCADPCRAVAQPQVIGRIQQNTQGVGSLSLRQLLSEQSSFCISSPLQQEALGRAWECITKLP